MKLKLNKNDFSQMKKNTVDSAKQLKENQLVRFVNPGGNGKRIMFVGNSITLHGVKEDIGWFNKYGMAASAKEKDYVHLLMKKFKEEDNDSTFCICQVADWERNYKNGASTYSYYEAPGIFGIGNMVLHFL